MEFLKILALCVVAAILYGIIHDQITARICVEYFTIGHPPVFGTNDPTLLGLGWGVLATWWGGVFLGLIIACVSRLGDWPKRLTRSLVKPIAILLGTMGVGAVTAGVIGYIGASNGSFHLPQQWASRVPSDKHVPFMTDLWAHNASYLIAFVGGIVLAVRILIGRRRGTPQGE